MKEGANARRTGLLCLFVTALGWGLTWPAMKRLLAELPPLTARGCAGLAALAIAFRQSLRVPQKMWRTILVASFVNVFVWMGFATLCLRWLSAGQGALLLYTMPVWAILLAWPLLHQRPTAKSIAALALCLCGLWVLFGGGGLPLDSGYRAGIVFALAAAVIFAWGTVTLKPIEGLGPLTAVAWQLVCGCVPMLVLAAAIEQPQWARVSPVGWMLFAYVVLIPMGVCYLTWFAALRRLPIATAATATLLTPVVGVLAGAIALGEPMGWRELGALALTLSGVALAVRRGNSALARRAATSDDVS